MCFNTPLPIERMLKKHDISNNNSLLELIYFLNIPNNGHTVSHIIIAVCV